MNQANASINFLDTGEQVLPFRCLVMAPIVIGASWETHIEPVTLSKANLNQVIAQFSPSIDIPIESDFLCQFLDVELQPLSVAYTFKHLNDFTPKVIINHDPSLLQLDSCLSHLQELLQHSQFDLEEYEKTLVQLSPQITADGSYLRRKGAERLVLDIQESLNDILNQLLHHNDWQMLEQTWRSLFWLCEVQANCRECLIDIYPVSKELLWDDYTQSSSITDSDLYHLLYTKNYGQYGATPYSALIIDDYFSNTGSDLTLIKHIAEIASSAHIPVITGTSPKVFGVEDFSHLSQLEDLHELHSGAKYIKWQNFIASDIASYVVFTLPRIRIRPLYDKSHFSSDSMPWYNERFQSSEDYVWANASYGFVINLMKSFNAHGFCSSIVGQHAGSVDYSLFNGNSQQLPLEITLPQKKDAAIINLGFNPINAQNEGQTMLFKSANSVRWGHVTQLRKKQSHDSMASAQLSYLMIVLRIIHCIKILFRERVGSHDSTAEIQNYLNNWVRQFVSAVNVPSETLRAQRPLKEASVVVLSQQHEGWYDISLNLQPHLKFLGENINVDFGLSIQDRRD